MAKSFSYVYVPADEYQGVEEKQLSIPAGRDVECFLDEIKAQLTSTPVIEAQHTEARKQALLKSMPAGTNVTDELMNAAGGLQLVESVPLLTNSKKNGFVGVNMYVDDCGSIKNLPINRRATEICQLCGRMLEVHGDAWIARIFDNEDDFKRLDFKQAELSSSAAWVKLAHEQQQERLRADTAQTAFSRLQASASARPAAPVVTELNPAEASKEEGNAAFKKGDFAAAVEHYSRCLDQDSAMIAARNNRAMALLKLSRWQEALSDCGIVLMSEPTNVKALLRKAEAHRWMGQTEQAQQAFDAVLKVQGKNKEAMDGLAALAAART